MTPAELPAKLFQEPTTTRQKPEATEQYAEEHPNEDVEVVAGKGWRKNEDGTYSCTIKGCKQPNGYRPGGFKSFQAVRMHQTRMHQGKGNNTPPRIKIKEREVLRKGDGKTQAGSIDDIKDLVNGKTEAPDWSHEDESGGVVSSSDKDREAAVLAEAQTREALIEKIQLVLGWHNSSPVTAIERRRKVIRIIDLVKGVHVATVREPQRPEGVQIKIVNGTFLVKTDDTWQAWSLADITAGLRFTATVMGGVNK